MLTPAQRRAIVSEAASGDRIPVIARRHSVAEGQVKSAIGRVLRRHGVATRAALAAKLVGQRPPRAPDGDLAAKLTLELYDSVTARLRTRIMELETEVARLRAA